MKYEIAQGEPGGVCAYGGAREFVNYHGAEAIIHGPAETGKTFTALWKLNIAACKYPGASIVMARKVLNDVYASLWQTLKNKVFGPDLELWPCVPYGGLNRPSQLNYHNGSIIWLAGFDRSSKVLSAEHDIVFIGQAEECTLDDWETSTTRTTGRAGIMPYSQTIGDVNPAYPLHWMYHRESLKMFYSKHDENPTLYDQVTGEITEQGKHTMAVLNALTGVRRDRLLLGKPSIAEGAIYSDYSEARHLVYCTDSRFSKVKFKRYVCGVDWGLRNPGAMSVYGVTGDGVMVRVAEVYRSGETDEWWAARGVELNREFGIEAFVCDPSEPAYIMKFQRVGLNAVAGFNGVVPGITAVQQRLKNDSLYFFRSANRHIDQNLLDSKRPSKTEDEIPGYVWANNKTKEQPVKKDDHGCDALRYAVCYVDEVSSDQYRRPGAGANPININLDNFKAKRGTRQCQTRKKRR